MTSNDTDKQIEALKRQLEERDRKRRAASIQAAVVAMSGALLGLFVSATQLSGVFRLKPARSSIELATRQHMALRDEMKGLEARMQKTEEFARTIAVPTGDASVEQRHLSAALTAMGERLRTMESAISENPERALSIPLLRKDLENNAKHLEEYRVATRADVDRLYDQQKWMLGGIGAVLLAVAGGAITIILKSLPKVSKDDA